MPSFSRTPPKRIPRHRHLGQNSPINSLRPQHCYGHGPQSPRRRLARRNRGVETRKGDVYIHSLIHKYAANNVRFATRLLRSLAFACCCKVIVKTCHSCNLLEPDEIGKFVAAICNNFLFKLFLPVAY